MELIINEKKKVVGENWCIVYLCQNWAFLFSCSIIMYLYTGTVYFAIEAADLLWRGAYCPHNDAEMIHDLIIASQIVGAKHHANGLVHYLFVPGDKRFTSKVRTKFLKSHVRFYGSTGKHDLAAFYQSVGRKLVKPSQAFLNEDVFNIG